MRVALVTYYYLPHVGGGTWFPYHVGKGLAARGHAITLYAPSVRFGLVPSSEPSADAGGPAIERLNRAPLPTWFAPFIGILLLRPRTLRRLKESDVIIAQYHPHHSIAFGAIIAAKFVRRPIALRVEDTRRWMFGGRPRWRTRIEYWLAGPLNRANEWAASRAGFLMLATGDEAAAFARHSRSAVPTVVTGNGVDTEAIAKLPSRAELRTRLRIPPSTFMVVFAGRFSGGEYGLDAVLAAFEALRAFRPGVLLVLVGDRLPARFMERYRDLLTTGAILAPGAVPQLQALTFTAAADIAIGPLFPTAATPLKVVEALAVGTPVVSGEGSLGPELRAFDSEIEFVQPSPQALGEALIRRASRSSSGAGPRNPPGLRRFSWAAIVDLVDVRLRQLVAERKSSEATHGV